jgi:hypothetical protein
MIKKKHNFTLVRNKVNISLKSKPSLLIVINYVKSSAVPDVAAYLPDEIWEPLLTSMDQTQSKLLKRY